LENFDKIQIFKLRHEYDQGWSVLSTNAIDEHSAAIVRRTDLAKNKNKKTAHFRMH
jgi:hypothetical protein